MEKVKVDLGDQSYPIYLGTDIYHELGQVLRSFSKAQKAMIISNQLVYGLYGSKVQKSLEEAGFETSLALMGDGEAYKSLATAADLFDQAVDSKLDRQSLIVALGGGVVGDMAGFIAATYMRGIPFIQVPTTLLAQVDSSVGGKVAVNHPKGKNIIGSFYQPKLVYTDLATLKTLPEREIKTGLAEVIKYGVIWDEEFFHYLDSRAEEIWQLKEDVLLELVKRSCTIKALVVSQDEKEQGLRAILNFGHTFGHAIEALTGYKVYRHGEAVAIGMVQASRLAEVKGILTPAAREKIVETLVKLRLPIACQEEFSAEEMLNQMLYDKKAQDNKIHFVLPTDIGQVKIFSDIPTALVEESFLMASSIEPLEKE